MREMDKARIALFIFLFIVGGGFVYADITDNNLRYFALDGDCTDSLGIESCTTDGTFTNPEKHGTNSLTLTGDGQELDIEINGDNMGAAWTTCGWFNSSDWDGTTREYLFSTSPASGDFGLTVRCKQSSGALEVFSYCASDCTTNYFQNDVANACDGGSFTDNQYSYVCVVHEDIDTIKLYIDAVLKTTLEGSSCSGGASNFQCGTNQDIWLGNARNDATNEFSGFIDEVTVWDRALNIANISEMYNSGTGYFYDDMYPTSSNSTINHTIEKTTEIPQNSPITINNPTYQTILTGNINITNTTNISISTALNAIALNRNGTLFCRVDFNGNYYNTTSNRSMTLNEYGAMYFKSSVFEISSGFYPVTFECARDSPGINNIEISNTNIIIHELIDSLTSVPLNYVAADLTATINSNTYSKVWAYNFSTTAHLVDGETKKHIILNGNLFYNYVSTGEISTYLIINGTSFGEYPRYGSAGSIGSTGGLFYKIPSPNVSEAQNISIEIWAKSTTSDGSINGKAELKEEVMHIDEANHTTLNGTSINSATYTHIKNITINNNDHSGGNLVVKAGIPLKATVASARPTFRVRIGTTNGSEIIRDVTAINQAGIAIIQDIFSITTGIKTVTLEGKTNNNIDIVGGDMVAYMSSLVPFSQVSFNVTAFNHWNGSAINNFNVTTTAGTIFTTTNGEVQVSTLIATENLTLTNGVYLPRTILNHNTSTNLNTTLWQSVLYVEAQEVITGNTINSFTATIGSTINASNATGTAVFYPNAGTYTIYIGDAGAYYNNTGSATIGLFETQTANITLGYALLNVTAQNSATNQALTTFTVNITNLGNNYSQIFSTTTGHIDISLINDTYTLLTDSGAYTTNTTNTTIIYTLQNITIGLWELNSIWLNVYDEITEQSLLGTNVTVEIISNIYSNNVSFVNGTFNTSFLTPTEYELRYSANNYHQRSYYFTLSNNTVSFIDLYLINDSTAISSLILMSVEDKGGNYLEDATVKAQRYYSSDNSWRTVEMQKSNFFGLAGMHLQTQTAYYKFIIEYGGAVRLTTGGSLIYNTDQLYFSVNTQDSAIYSQRNIKNVYKSLVFDNATKTFSYTWADTTGLVLKGCLRVSKKAYGRETILYDQCTTSTGGTLGHTLINPLNDTQYIGMGYIDTDTSASEYVTDILEYFVPTKYLGNRDLGLFMSFMLICIITFIGLWKPAIGIVANIIGVIFTAYLGFYIITIEALIGLIIIGGFLAVKMRQ